LKSSETCHLVVRLKAADSGPLFISSPLHHLWSPLQATLDLLYLLSPFPEAGFSSAIFTRPHQPNHQSTYFDFAGFSCTLLFLTSIQATKDNLTFRISLQMGKRKVGNKYAANRSGGHSRNIYGSVHGPVNFGPQVIRPSGWFFLCHHIIGQCFTDKIPDLSTQDRIEKIKECLYYESMNDRVLDIQDPHEKTFKWLFASRSDSGLSDAQTTQSVKFQYWLKTGSGIF
jgi:hypothetical protein